MTWQSLVLSGSVSEEAGASSMHCCEGQLQLTTEVIRSVYFTQQNCLCSPWQLFTYVVFAVGLDVLKQLPLIMIRS